MSKLRVLHLAGSPTNDFFYDLSLVYARDCAAALAGEIRFVFESAVVLPDGTWKFPDSLEQGDINAAPARTISESLEQLALMQPDVAIPQSFCLAGMTDLRATLSLLQIPFVGNRAETMALAADKAKTKAVVSAAGVKVPEGQLICPHDAVRIRPPAVVKPNSADNSTGVRLVSKAADYPAAIAKARRHGEAVLIEKYIEPGREVRCGIVQRGNALQCLPLQEYRVDAESRPIRTYSSKLTTDASGQLDLTSKYDPQSWIVGIDDPITELVWNAAQVCHRALGCRDYSLFDFRIDPEGNPWFLEAGLYCSFAPNSIVTSMMAATGVGLPEFFAQMVSQSLQSQGSDQILNTAMHETACS